LHKFVHFESSGVAFVLPHHCHCRFTTGCVLRMWVYVCHSLAISLLTVPSTWSSIHQLRLTNHSLTRPHAQFAHAGDPTRSPPQGQMDSHHNLKAPMLCCTLHHARYRSSVPSALASTGSCLAVADVLRPLDGAEAQFTCGGTCLLSRALLCGQAAAHSRPQARTLRQGCSHLRERERIY
jgi:hypothetical protein